jgi:hypothetical protein
MAPAWTTASQPSAALNTASGVEEVLTAGEIE